MTGDIWKLPSASDAAQLHMAFPIGNPIHILEACSRFLWTGINQPNTFVDGIEFRDGTPLEITGIGVLRWLQQNAGLNSGLGPTIACGALAHLYIAACASYGIYAREVAACNATGISDITAEYWNPASRRWVHVIPWCNSMWRTTKGYVGYVDWSRDMRRDGKTKARRYSTTSGLPLSRAMDYFLTYVPTLTAVGCVSNGNGIYVDGESHCHMWKIWDDLGPSNPYKDYTRECDVKKLYLPPEPLR